MKNKKLTKVWAERHLPSEIWREILCKLPVKSLVRFRCVSKSWLSLIDDHDFGRLHLKNFKNNRQETHLLAVEGRKRQCFVRCSDTYKTTDAKTIGKHGRWVVEEGWHFECSVDGLVLLKRRSRDHSRSNELMVWNPSIRKVHSIPSLPEIENSPDRALSYTEIGLGYDPLVNNYKHVKLIFADPDILHSVAVYTFGAASWTISQFQGKGRSDWHWDLSSIKTEKVYLRGSLYFSARDLNCSVWEVVSIDLSSEVLSSTSLPDSPCFKSDYLDGRLTLVDGGCSLGVITSEPSGSSSLWVLEESSGAEGEPVRWMKRYSFSLKVCKLLYLKKNGDILSRRCVQETLFWWNRVISYNMETEEEKILLRRKRSRLWIYNVCGYVESLVGIANH